jgi:competence protein ComEC
MTLFALGFVVGAWLLQQQTLLPNHFIGLQAAWILVPSGIIFSRVYLSNYSLLFKKFCTLVFAGLLGLLWAANFVAIRLSDELPADWQQKSINVIGVVASLPEVTERGERFRFDVEKTLTSGAQVPKHISLNFYRDVKSPRTENAPNLGNYFQAGERWQFTVRLKRPHTTYNPHGFDFEAWALAENIRATGSIYSKSGYKKLTNFVWRPSYMVESVRENIGNHISKALANKPYAGVIRALVVGDDSQISAENWNIFLRTGVNHLVSISGLHITMLAGLAFAISGFIWRRIPSLVMRMPTRKAATIFGLVVAIIYALLAGMSVPTQRTLFMLLTFAWALLFGKNLAISRALAIAVLVVIIIDPWAVIAPGFWLSFGAVALIAYVSVGRLNPLSTFKAAIHTQWAITLGLLPLLIVMFGQSSVISPVANAFAIPVISLLVVPLSIFGSVLQLDFVLTIAHFILQICMLGLVYLANLPTWQQAAPPIWALFLAITGVVWLLLPRGFPQRWMGAILLLPLFYVNPPKIPEGAMRATVLDVGQGLALVIQTKNHTLLYDAGPNYSSQSDAGGRIVVPFLRGQGVKKLDGFIISHNDADHSGGAPAVLAQLPVSWLLSSFDTVEISQKKSTRCFAGQRWLWDGVKFEVLYPTKSSYQNANLSDNNKSCVLKITSQFGSLLVTGDIEKEAENSLLNALENTAIDSDALQANIHEASGDVIFSRTETKFKSKLKSDVLIAAHHGSKTSSTVHFVQAVGARHVIFTVGYLNRFKHPKPLIEKRFEESGAITYRSDYLGALVLDFAHTNNISINALRQSQPRYWHDKY